MGRKKQFHTSRPFFSGMKQPFSDILFSNYTSTLCAAGFSALAPVQVCLLRKELV